MNTSAANQTQLPLRAVESDALIESSFRRLLSAIEAERSAIRGTWQQLQQERDTTTAELERLQQDTKDWCYSEKNKIDAEWRRLDMLSKEMSDMFPASDEAPLEINCAGQFFTIPRRTLCSIEGSTLNQLFSDEGIKQIPLDDHGRLYLDFNPVCFALVIEYLQNRRLRLDAPLPVIPVAQMKNMEMLAEAWKLKPFLRENQINPVHGTSLHVAGNRVRATHPGWQVITSQHPLPMAASSRFEVKVLKNPDPKGDGAAGACAFGICTHIPTGKEVHSVRVPEAVMYASNNGLIGDLVTLDEVEKVTKGVRLAEGSVLGVRHDVSKRCLEWYHGHELLGTSAIKEDMQEKALTLYPVFALCDPDQTIQVEFRANDAAAVPEEVVRGELRRLRSSRAAASGTPALTEGG